MFCVSVQLQVIFDHFSVIDFLKLMNDRWCFETKTLFTQTPLIYPHRHTQYIHTQSNDWISQQTRTNTVISKKLFISPIHNRTIYIYTWNIVRKGPFHRQPKSFAKTLPPTSYPIEKKNNWNYSFWWEMRKEHRHATAIATHLMSFPHKHTQHRHWKTFHSFIVTCSFPISLMLFTLFSFSHQSLSLVSSLAPEPKHTENLYSTAKKFSR